ncbi:MAG TPA: hypothetical protein VHM02_01970 [Thermoanaerobaculia bacterium]|nr:hypothetical protein [Thermoanaerobaculia bacterium]
MEATATNREGDRPIDPAPAAPGVPRGRGRRPRWIALAGGLASLVAILGWFELTSYRQVIGLVLDEQAPEAPAGPGPQASIATGVERAAEPAEESRSEPSVRRERPPLAAQRTVELDRFEARLRSCRANGSTVTCDFLVESTRRDVTVFLRGSSRLIDFAGNESRAASLAFGQNRIEGGDRYFLVVSNRLVASIPTSIQIKFEDVPLEGGGAALVELVLDPLDGKEVNVQFRDVAVAR